MFAAIRRVSSLLSKLGTPSGGRASKVNFGVASVTVLGLNTI